MKITLTEAAAKFFREEVDPQPGQGIHIYGKVYGQTNVHDNYSVGILVEEPVDPIASAEVGDILVYAEQEDAWFFGDYDLEIDYDAENEVPTYHFTSTDPSIAAQAQDTDANTGASKRI